MLEYVTYVMNAQTLEELEFGIDVVRRSTGETVAKGFVPADCMDELEGKLSVSLVGVEDFGLAGHFKATYLVVTALVRFVSFCTWPVGHGWAAVVSEFDDDRQGARATVSHLVLSCLTVSHRVSPYLTVALAATNNDRIIRKTRCVASSGRTGRRGWSR